MAQHLLGLNKEQIKHLYCVERLSCEEIAHRLNCGSTTVWRYLKQYGVPLRPRVGHLPTLAEH